MELTTGGAHSAYGNTQVGDQKQASIPDYSGEVSLRDYTEASFNSRWKGYILLRPQSTALASALAKTMIQACNNANIGYSQGSRLGIRDHGTNSPVPTNCDCSSLVYQCLNECAGTSIMGTTATLQADFVKTNLFMDPGTFTSVSETTPYNGDVLVKAGTHTEIVVSGNPRDGSEDEIVFSTASGSASQVFGYRMEGEIQFTFEPRTTSPEGNVLVDEYYSNNYGFNKNGSYAWGRFSEIMQSHCDLSRSMAKKWYSHTEDKYQRGSVPALGAVMCYTNIKNNSLPGLVSIVELVHPNYIYVSQYSLDTLEFQYIKRIKYAGSWDLDLYGDGFKEYMFQGFIYNSAITTSVNSGKSFLSEFMTTANSFVGKGIASINKHVEVKANSPWSAAFITTVASITGGLLNVIIPKVTSCTAYKTSGADRKMGTWIDGPILNNYPVPQLGDLILFRNKQIETATKYYADKVGIVAEISSAKNETSANGKESNTAVFAVIIGDYENSVKKLKFNSRSASILGIYRPAWEQIDGGAPIQKYVTSSLAMYTEGTDIEDAAIRDLSYAEYSSSSFKPSIKKTGITLSALNYTGMLANFYSVLAETSTSAENEQGLIANFWNNTALSNFHLELADEILGGVPNSAYSLSWSGSGDTNITAVDGSSIKVTSYYDGKPRTETMTLSANVKMIYQLINTQLDNPAGTIGIMANMFQESKWNPAASNSIGASGLVQWADTSKTANFATQMKDYCKTHGNKQAWPNNLSGQIECLFYWVTTENLRIEGMTKIRSVENTLQGAQNAAVYFLDYMEIGKGNWGTKRDMLEQELRKGWARGVWTLFFGDKV